MLTKAMQHALVRQLHLPPVEAQIIWVRKYTWQDLPLPCSSQFADWLCRHGWVSDYSDELMKYYPRLSLRGLSIVLPPNTYRLKCGVALHEAYARYVRETTAQRRLEGA